MPKVREVSERGVKVVGQIRDFSGQPISGRDLTITLPVVCAWRGKFLATRQNSVTDARGEFVFWLPPTKQLKPVDGSKPPKYHIVAKGVGAWEFEVPADQAVFMLGEPLEK